jgi:LysM repeat protein
MTDDRKLKINDDWSEESTSTLKRRPIGSGNGKFLHILLIFLLILIFAGGIIYFLGRGLTGGGTGLLPSKVTALEQKIAAIEEQLAELQGKPSASGSDPALLQRVDALARKVETLEKQKQPIGGSKSKPSVSSRPAGPTDKQYHTVQKGETLYRISKKYGISTEELRKWNNLSAHQPIRTGQKLLVSSGR